RHLAWLFGPVRGVAVGEHQFVPIGGGKGEIRGTGKIRGNGTRELEYLEIPLAVVRTQLGGRPNRPVRRRRARNERDTFRGEPTSRDLKGLDLRFRRLGGDGKGGE